MVQYDHKYSGLKTVGIIPLLIVGLIVLGFQLVWLRENRSKFLSPTTVALFKQILRSQTLSVNCHVCNGLGYIVSPVDPGVTNECPVCFGSKKHSIRIFNDRESICPTCLGMGRVLIDPHAGAGGICPTCRGRGVVTFEVPKQEPIMGRRINVECPMCSGIGTVQKKDADSGRVRALCPLCFGVGHHTIYKYKPEHTLCPACGGIGRLEDAETGEIRFCNRCHGRGLIEIHALKTNIVVQTAAP